MRGLLQSQTDKLQQSIQLTATRDPSVDLRAMCGIFGIVTHDDQPLGDTPLGAARRLSYRGYDSVGAATSDRAGHIDLRKDVGKVDEVAPRRRDRVCVWAVRCSGHPAPGRPTGVTLTRERQASEDPSNASSSVIT